MSKKRAEAGKTGFECERSLIQIKSDADLCRVHAIACAGNALARRGLPASLKHLRFRTKPPHFRRKQTHPQTCAGGFIVSASWVPANFFGGVFSSTPFLSSPASHPCFSSLPVADVLFFPLAFLFSCVYQLFAGNTSHLTPLLCVESSRLLGLVLPHHRSATRRIAFSVKKKLMPVRSPA